MTTPALDELATLVRTAAREELMPRFARVERGHKADGSILTEADLAMQERIQRALRERWGTIGFMGEEMEGAEQARLLADDREGVWCLDPLDGTSNFAAGIPYFSVSLALIRRGEVVLGIVHDPVRDETFSARRGGGAWLDGEPLTAAPPPALAKCSALIDFKRLPPELAARLVQERPYGSQRSFGSVALDWCWIAAGRCHVYLHGRQNIWDYAAGHLILEEAGGRAVTLEGEPVFRAALEARSAVAARDPELFEAWRRWLAIPA